MHMTFTELDDGLEAAVLLGPADRGDTLSAIAVATMQALIVARFGMHARAISVQGVSGQARGPGRVGRRYRCRAAAGLGPESWVSATAVVLDPAGTAVIRVSAAFRLTDPAFTPAPGTAPAAGPGCARSSG